MLRKFASVSAAPRTVARVGQPHSPPALSLRQSWRRALTVIAQDSPDCSVLVHATRGGERAVVTQKPQSTGSILARIAAYLLPAGYPSSVAASYTPYALRSAAGVVVSSAGGVLSMQCMLYAVGLGAGALPLAAGINWVVKDGVGQLGGVLGAALINTRFDADPKRWRFISALLLDTASALEICTAFHPSLFLPVASLANVLKNVAWLSSSATRAALHQSLGRGGGNLADVTAKAGSQTIGAATIGTACGVALSSYLGAGEEHLHAIATAFACLSAANLFFVHASLSAAVLPTLSSARLRLACEAVLTAPSVGVGGGGPGRGGTSPATPTPVLTPHAVSRKERFLPFYQHAGARVAVNPLLTGCAGIYSFARASGAVTDGGSAGQYKHVVWVSERGSVAVLHCEGGGWRDALLGHLHALRLAATLVPTGAPLSLDARLCAVEEGRVWLDLHGEVLLSALEGAGWWVGTPLVEPDASRRVTLTQAETTGGQG